MGLCSAVGEGVGLARLVLTEAGVGYVVGEGVRLTRLGLGGAGGGTTVGRFAAAVSVTLVVTTLTTAVVTP